jgi:hypothetical protein
LTSGTSHHSAIFYSSELQLADLPTNLPCCLDELFHQFAHLSLLRHSISYYGGTGISTSCPSATPFGLTLGPDLPRADEPSSGNLRFSTDGILTHLFATHTGILTSNISTSPFDLASSSLERSPTIPVGSVASVKRLAPVHFRRRVTRLVSYYALFEWWLLLSQHPSCLCVSTSFTT